MDVFRLPRYPIYIPSRSRADVCSTPTWLMKDGVPFRLVVEPQEADEYSARFGPDRILILPFRDRGSVVPARNWIKDHATDWGYERHWQIDDNIVRIARRFRCRRISCDSGPAMAAVEDFVDRYENVAIAGINYTFFARDDRCVPPFYLNARVYSFTLVLNRMPQRWRGRYNEDTDICLQVLSAGWCTVLVNAFVAEKSTTMTVPGGNTDTLYKGDGRLKMARSLERAWPGVVRVDRRFRRPQHVVRDKFGMFKTPLRLKPGIDLAELPKVDDYGLELRQIRPIRSESLRSLVTGYPADLRPPEGP